MDHPTPKATLTGHETEVTCVAVLAELGLVFSGSLSKFSGLTNEPIQFLSKITRYMWFRFPDDVFGKKDQIEAWCHMQVSWVKFSSDDFYIILIFF